MCQEARWPNGNPGDFSDCLCLMQPFESSGKTTPTGFESQVEQSVACEALLSVFDHLVREICVQPEFSRLQTGKIEHEDG